MMYADYKYYSETFEGTVVPSDSYNRWATRASKYLNQVTFNRITDAIEDVQMAACEIAEILYKAESTDGKDVVSESVGNQSISYTANSKTIEQGCYSVVKLYLSQTGLLDRGMM